MSDHFHAPDYSYRTSESLPKDTPKVQGYDFNQGVDHRALLQTYVTTGFQATNFGLAINQINSMIEAREKPMSQSEAGAAPPGCPCTKNCTVYLGYTSNMISSGVRESIRFLAEHHMVDVIVTTAGGIEEDMMKCMGSTYVGDFSLPGKDLYHKGIDRIGNLLIQDSTYSKFHQWMLPILHQMLLEQNTQGVKWTPSKLIRRLGKEIDNPASVCYWAYKNNISMFSPAITDGAIGDVLYNFAYIAPGLVLDINEDIKRINDISVASNNIGAIILGGGLIKHHLLNSFIYRNGANYLVLVNTGQESDGSDSGARPDEGVTWGKVQTTATPVKVFAEASIIFPLLVAETFATHFHKNNTGKKENGIQAS